MTSRFTSGRSLITSPVTSLTNSYPQPHHTRTSSAFRRMLRNRAEQEKAPALAQLGVDQEQGRVAGTPISRQKPSQTVLTRVSDTATQIERRESNLGVGHTNG